MITVQNITVETFSYIFKDKGIYVFENAASGTVTIIGVVGEQQQCSNTINGIGVSMITKESLAEIGIQSYNKDIKPNWWFIVLSFIFINGFVYQTIYCFLQAYELQAAQSGLINKGEETNTIYYDKLREKDEEQEQQNCLNRCKRNKKGNKIEDEEGEEGKKDKKHEFSVSYKDMEKLLSDFNTAQGILKRQMVDKEKREQKDKQIFEGSQADIDLNIAPEDELIGSL